MSGLIPLLPLLKGWKNDNKLETYPTIPAQNPGQSYRIGPFEYDGWIRCILGSVDNPFATFDHNVFEKPLVTTPYQLYVLSILSAPPTGAPWIYKFDTINNIYTIAWTPMPPQEFKKGTEIDVRAATQDLITGLPITTPTRILSSWVNVTLITNPDVFKDSLKEVGGWR